MSKHYQGLRVNCIQEELQPHYLKQKNILQHHQRLTVVFPTGVPRRTESIRHAFSDSSCYLKHGAFPLCPSHS